MKGRLHFIKLVSMMFIAALLVMVMEPASTVNAKTNWKKIYADYIKEDGWCREEADSARMIYINNDTIPEIYIMGHDAMVGNQLLSIYKGKVHVSYINGHGGISYVPKKGLVHSIGGNMDLYFDYVGKLVKGEIKYIEGGEFGAEDNTNVKHDSSGNPIYEYYWENQKVTKKTYKAKLKKAKGNYKYVSAYNDKKMLSMDKLKKKL